MSHLICADDCSGSHGLARSENTDEQVLLCHSPGSEGESQRDSQWQTLRNSDYDDSDSDDKDLDEALRLVVG